MEILITSSWLPCISTPSLMSCSLPLIKQLFHISLAVSRLEYDLKLECGKPSTWILVSLSTTVSYESKRKEEDTNVIQGGIFLTPRCRIFPAPSRS